MAAWEQARASRPANAGTRLWRSLLVPASSHAAILFGAASRSASLPAPLMKRRGNGERGLKAARRGLSRILLHVAHCRDGLERVLRKAWHGTQKEIIEAALLAFAATRGD